MALSILLLALPLGARERVGAPAEADEPERSSGVPSASGARADSPAAPAEQPSRAHALPEVIRDSLVALARAQLGRPYVFGGESPAQGFDCSGLVQWLLLRVGIDVPRTAAEQAHVGSAIDPAARQPLPGDLLVFGDREIEHVGIYIGAGRFIHASSVAGQVIESAVDRPPAPLIKPLAGVRAIDTLLASRHQERDG